LIDEADANIFSRCTCEFCCARCWVIFIRCTTALNHIYMYFQALYGAIARHKALCRRSRLFS
jgi:hypothetical protein